MCRFWWAVTRISDFGKARSRKHVGREREVTDTLKLTMDGFRRVYDLGYCGSLSERAKAGT